MGYVNYGAVDTDLYICPYLYMYIMWFVADIICMPIPSLDFGFTRDSCRNQDRSLMDNHIHWQNLSSRMVCALFHSYWNADSFNANIAGKPGLDGARILSLSGFYCTTEQLPLSTVAAFLGKSVTLTSLVRTPSSTTTPAARGGGNGRADKWNFETCANPLHRTPVISPLSAYQHWQFLQAGCPSCTQQTVFILKYVCKKFLMSSF